MAARREKPGAELSFSHVRRQHVFLAKQTFVQGQGEDLHTAFRNKGGACCLTKVSELEQLGRNSHLTAALTSEAANRQDAIHSQEIPRT